MHLPVGQATTKNVDCIVIGAGIAGASVAAALAGEASVALLEAEAQAGYHSTGRSAALYSALYGNATIRALTRASLGYFRTPSQGMVKQALLRERHTLFLVGAGQEGLVEGFTADADVRERTSEARAGMELEISDAYESVIDARSRTESYDRGRRETRAWFIAAAQAVDVGAADLSDLTDAVSGYFLARFAHLQAIHDLDVAIANLERVSAVTVTDRWETGCE